MADAWATVGGAPNQRFVNGIGPTTGVRRLVYCISLYTFECFTQPRSTCRETSHLFDGIGALFGWRQKSEFILNMIGIHEK